MVLSRGTVDYPGNAKLAKSMCSIGELLGLNKTFPRAVELDIAILQNNIFKLDCTFITDEEDFRLVWWPAESTFQILILDTRREIRCRLSMFHDKTIRPVFNKSEYKNYLAFRERIIDVEFPKLKRSLLMIKLAVNKIRDVVKRMCARIAYYQIAQSDVIECPDCEFKEQHSASLLKAACMRMLPSSKLQELIWESPGSALMIERNQAQFKHLSKIGYRAGRRRLVKRH